MRRGATTPVLSFVCVCVCVHAEAALDSVYRAPVSSVMGRGNHASTTSDAGSATDAATAYKQALKLCGEGTYGKALTVSAQSSSLQGPYVIIECMHRTVDKFGLVVPTQQSCDH